MSLADDVVIVGNRVHSVSASPHLAHSSLRRTRTAIFYHYQEFGICQNVLAAVALITVLEGLTGVRNNYNNQRGTPLYGVAPFLLTLSPLSRLETDSWTDFSVSYGPEKKREQARVTDGREREDKGGPTRQENALLFRLGRLVSFASLGARRLGGPPLVPSGITDRAKNLMRLICDLFPSWGNRGRRRQLRRRRPLLRPRLRPRLPSSPSAGRFAP